MDLSSIRKCQKIDDFNEQYFAKFPLSANDAEEPVVFMFCYGINHFLMLTYIRCILKKDEKLLHNYMLMYIADLWQS